MTIFKYTLMSIIPDDEENKKCFVAGNLTPPANRPWKHKLSKHWIQAYVATWLKSQTYPYFQITSRTLLPACVWPTSRGCDGSDHRPAVTPTRLLTPGGPPRELPVIRHTCGEAGLYIKACRPSVTSFCACPRISFGIRSMSRCIIGGIWLVKCVHPVLDCVIIVSYCAMVLPLRM